jgi:predicted CopG family antitoxin
MNKRQRLKREKKEKQALSEILEKLKEFIRGKLDGDKTRN